MFMAGSFRREGVTAIGAAGDRCANNFSAPILRRVLRQTCLAAERYRSVSFGPMTGTHDARERLVAAAEELLMRSGPRAVSMDAAAAVAGAGKMSAYRHFDDRDDLVAAALERRRPRHLRWLLGSARGDAPGTGQDRGGDAAGPMLAAFDRLESAAAVDSFRGCPFVDAALAAPPAPSAPGNGGNRAAAIAWRHKEDLMGELAALAERAGLAEPDQLGAAVALLIDGCAAQAALATDRAAREEIVRRGRRAARVLIASAGRR
jgi:AcrR family transcriptional regulator